MDLRNALPDTEYLTVGRDRCTGLIGIIAIDATTLGPALGGIRWMAYASEDAATFECRRLGRVMSLKNALAEIGFGGGKAVIMASDAVHRPSRGRHSPGTGVEDLLIVRVTAGDVSRDDADPSISTPIGVHAAIQQAVRVTGLSRTLQDVSVLVQGAGRVGARLAELLARDGARILVADNDSRRAAAVARCVSGLTVDPGDALHTECDVFAPCAVARVIDEESVRHVAARVVAGAANDVLADSDMAIALAERGIIYVPDFVASAGGVVQVRALRDEWSPGRLQGALEAIGQRTADVLEEAASTDTTPMNVAEAAAYARLGRPRPKTAHGDETAAGMR